MLARQSSQRAVSHSDSLTKHPASAPLTRATQPTALIQHARVNLGGLTPTDVLQLQRTIGNRAVATPHPLSQKTQNKTGIPDPLKSGIESLGGISMVGVKVHYNSPQPAQLNALAYAQGSDIHIAPGQERHLSHEAWHLVQQAQGRVRPTTQLKDRVPVNNDAGLEHEADVMGTRAMQARRPADIGPDTAAQMVPAGGAGASADVAMGGQDPAHGNAGEPGSLDYHFTPSIASQILGGDGDIEVQPAPAPRPNTGMAPIQRVRWKWNGTTGLWDHEGASSSTSRPPEWAGHRDGEIVDDAIESYSNGELLELLGEEAEPDHSVQGDEDDMDVDGAASSQSPQNDDTSTTRKRKGESEQRSEPGKHPRLGPASSPGPASSLLGAAQSRAAALARFGVGVGTPAQRPAGSTKRRWLQAAAAGAQSPAAVLATVHRNDIIFKVDAPRSGDHSPSIAAVNRTIHGPIITGRGAQGRNGAQVHGQDDVPTLQFTTSIFTPTKDQRDVATGRAAHSALTSLREAHGAGEQDVHQTHDELLDATARAYSNYNVAGKHAPAGVNLPRVNVYSPSQRGPTLHRTEAGVTVPVAQQIINLWYRDPAFVTNMAARRPPTPPVASTDGPLEWNRYFARYGQRHPGDTRPDDEFIRSDSKGKWVP
jgi:hypothetical protein